MPEAKQRHLNSVHRLAAIMFTDIVGYTTMMSKDEHATLALLRTNRETHKKLILEFGGQLLKEMGDGILASFENSSDSVICAAAIQKASMENQIQLRIGIHMGEVTFENNDVFGDGVNIASRIQPLAEPSQILISETVHHNVHNKPGITTQFLGERELKNVIKAVAIYIVEVEDDFLIPGARIEEKKPVAPLIISIAVVAALLFTAVGGYWFGTRSVELPNTNAVVRYEISLENQLSRDGAGPIALSHDGNYLCYTSGGSLIIKRLAENGNGLKIAGPWDPRGPAFSSDGNWILFEDVSTSKLMKVPVTGGNAQVILSFDGRITGMYGTDNEIVFSEDNAFYKVDLNGGIPEKIYPRDTAAFATYVWKPQLLPDKKTLLFHQFVDQSPVVKVVRLDKSEAAKVIIDQSYEARYLDSGHLVFDKEGSLQIVPFDLRSNSTTGSPRVITSGVGNFAVSNQGTLVYQPAGEIETGEKHLVWIDLEGNIEKISEDPKILLSPRISDDGQQIVVDFINRESLEIAIYNPVLGTATNFITKDSTISPIWASDNNTIAYFQFGDPQGIFVKPVDNTYAPKLLFETEEIAILGNWSNDGRYLVFSTSGDIGYFDFADSTVTYLDYINTEEEFSPALSPDGKWLAYTSDRERQDHIYVVPFPGPGRAHRVSVDEGFASVWAPDMSAIYFVGEDDKGLNLSRANITTSPQFSSSPPQVLFYGRHTTLYKFANTNRYELGNSGLFDIHPDGRRFLMEQSVSEKEIEDLQDRLKLQVIVNWPELLKEDN